MVETLSIAVIGDPGVGKTSIIRQFLYNDFTEVYTPTNSRSGWICVAMESGLPAYILVYDICCMESFEYIKMIRQQIVDNRASSSGEAPILVVGSKRDLQRQRFTSRRAVSLLVKKTWKCGYIECSAKYNWHITLLFKELLASAVARRLKHNHSSIRLQGALHRNRCSIM